MAFTFEVEIGDSSPTANSYVDTTFAATYHEEMGNDTTWNAATTVAQQKALVQATRYVDMRFGKRFRGVREQRDQSLEWPRIGARDNDGFLFIDTQSIPSQLKKAVTEYALRALAGALITDPTSATVGELTEDTNVVGPIRTTKKYATRRESAASNAQLRAPQSGMVDDSLIPQYPAADMWMSELLRSGHTTTWRRK